MKKKTVILLHVIYWTLLLSSYIGKLLIQNNLSIDFIGISNVYIMMSLPFIFYFSYLLIFKILQNKKTLLYAAIILVCLTMIIPFVLQVSLAFGLYILLFILPTLFTGGLFRFFIDWIKKRQAAITIIQTKLTK